MRPYRGKRKDNGEWVYGWYIKYNLLDYILPVIHSIEIKFVDCFVEVHPSTVGQSTGLCDKTGKDSYYRDKVLWDWNKKHRNIEGIIDWDEERLAWIIKNDYFQNNKKVFLANHPEIEIIGTIHDEEKP